MGAPNILHEEKRPQLDVNSELKPNTVAAYWRLESPPANKVVVLPAQKSKSPVIVGGEFTVTAIALLTEEVQPVAVFKILKEYVPAAETESVLADELSLHRYTSSVPKVAVVVKEVLLPAQIDVAPVMVGEVGDVFTETLIADAEEVQPVTVFLILKE